MCVNEEMECCEGVERDGISAMEGEVDERRRRGIMMLAEKKQISSAESEGKECDWCRLLVVVFVRACDGRRAHLNNQGRM